jgi:hypothetical protein
MTLHLTRSSRLWDTSTPSTSTPLRKKKKLQPSLWRYTHVLIIVKYYQMFLCLDKFDRSALSQ